MMGLVSFDKISQIDTHTHNRFNSHFPVEPGLAGCPLNSPSLFIPGLRSAHPFGTDLSVLVLSPLRAQQFGILCLTVCVIQLLGLISFDVT